MVSVTQTGQESKEMVIKEMFMARAGMSSAKYAPKETISLP